MIADHLETLTSQNLYKQYSIKLNKINTMDHYDKQNYI